MTTENIIDDMAVIKVASTLDNQSKMSANVKLSMTICSPTDEVVQTVETPIKNVAKGSSEFVQTITLHDRLYGRLRLLTCIRLK